MARTLQLGLVALPAALHNVLQSWVQSRKKHFTTTEVGVAEIENSAWLLPGIVWWWRTRPNNVVWRPTGAATWRTRRNIRVVYCFRRTRSKWKHDIIHITGNMRNILHCRERNWATDTRNGQNMWINFGVWFWDMRANRQADRQTRWSKYILHLCQISHLSDEQRLRGHMPWCVHAIDILRPEHCQTDTVGRSHRKQVAELSLTNPLDALHHDKRQNFKSNHVTITTPLLLVICHPVARIDIAYLCTKFDD